MPSQKHTLKQLLPQGRYWEIKPSAAFDRYLGVMGATLDLVQESLDGLLDSLTPTHGRTRFETLTGLKRLEAIAVVLNRQASLSRQYVTQRLGSLGYTFTIYDPTDELGGLVDEMIGHVYFHTQLTEIRPLRAGFEIGSRVTEWRDLEFERAACLLVPAYVTPVFVYEKGN